MCAHVSVSVDVCLCVCVCACECVYIFEVSYRIFVGGGVRKSVK